MRYFMVHFKGCKEVDRETYEKHTKNKLRDVIDWYDDGENLFFGGCSCSEEMVMAAILKTLGKINIDFCLWGI